MPEATTRPLPMLDGPFISMRAWAEAKFGKPADEVTIADVERVLPHRDDLCDPPFTDSRGGRVRFNLRPWPGPDEADDLCRRAESFRAASPPSE